MDHLISQLPEPVRRAAEAGDWKSARRIIDRQLRAALPALTRSRLEFEKERLRRLALEYPNDRTQALRQLRRELKSFTDGELDDWIADGFIVPRRIEGKDRFFKSFVSNLIFLNPKLATRRRKTDPAAAEYRREIDRRVDELLAGDSAKRYLIRARISLELKDRPKEKVRCWLPFPRVADQVKAARLLAASHKRYRLAPAAWPQRTIHFEGRQRRYFVEFEYEIGESVTRLGTAASGPRAKDLAEQPPHIVFTPYVRKLVKAIVRGERSGLGKARRIYDWITLNVRYALTLPYGVHENLSEHTLVNLQGDCGAQAAAFITLCRAVGVPARWQSGWFISPKIASPHDWALFYAGGWRFADLSFGGSRRDHESRRRFYFGRLDACRMPANSEYAGPLWPPKKHPRSDPTDNQVGEVETASGNIYSDRFSHKIELLAFELIE